jgi:hypothetical protein
MAISVTCACGKTLRAKDELAGKRVKCPGCGAVSVLPAAAPVPVGVAPPVLVEPIDEPPATPRPHKVLRPDRRVEELPETPAGVADLPRAYTVNLGDWFRTANEHRDALFGPMVGYLLIFLAIWLGLVLLATVAIGYLGILFLVPQLAAGPTIVCLAQLKGQRWTFGDFFGGFRRYGTWLGIELLSALVGWVGMLPAVVVIVVLGAINDAAGVDPDGPVAAVTGFISLAAVLLGLVAGFYLWFRTSLFARQLIIDRGCGPIEAMQACWAITRGHFWGLFGVFALLIGIWSVAAVLTCGVAAVLGAPYVLLVLCAGYMHIAGTRPPVSRSAAARD